MRISFHVLFSLFVFAINVCDAQQVVRTGEMVVPRFFPTTTLLKDGRVLAIGGTRAAEVYDPTNGTWRRVGDMVVESFYPVAVRLHDGRVLIAGGSSLELFDPTTETFSTAGSVPGDIAAALRFPDGRVFLTDERGKNSALYDPVAGVIATLDTEAGIPIVLPDGRLVVIGSSSAWIYELKETSLKLLFRHDLGGTIYQRGAALLQDGNILVAGGGLNPYNGPPSRVAILYDPRHGTVRSTGSLPEAQMLFGITSLSNGSVLTSGGYDVFWADSNYYASPAIYDPSSEQFTSVPLPVAYSATQLQDGRVLVSGTDIYTGLGPTAFLYSPVSAGPDPWQQAITAIKAAGGSDSLNFWQWAWYWQYLPAFPGAPAGFGAVGSITPGVMEQIIVAGSGNGFQIVSAEQWMLYFRWVTQSLDPWQQAIGTMKAAAGSDSQNFWQWAWYWQYLPAFQGAPSGFGVVGSISPGFIEQIIVAGGGNGFQNVSAEQWVLYFRQVLP